MRRPPVTVAVTVALGAAALAAACGGAGDPGAADAAVDAGPPSWSPELPAADVMGGRRGLVPARGVVHLHSPYSHDACDGEPRGPDGALASWCLDDLRLALCRTRMTFAALTDHDDSMADEAFADLFLPRPGDEALAGAARLTCDDGHRILLFVGGENPLMPIMLDRHPDGTIEERHAIYDGATAATTAALRAAGGLVVIPHTEGHTVDSARALETDGLEIYNLHANLDPDIRAEHLGLPAQGAIQAVADFLDHGADGPEPDLALLSFLEPNLPAIAVWDGLLGEGRRIFGTAGADAHENALPLVLRDGERGDSYRRMMRWATNVALVTDADDPAAIEAAVAAGRSFVAFEVFGTPVGFDAVATGDGEPVELGGEIAALAGYQLEVAVPSVFALDPALPAPTISARILRVDEAGPHEVAAGAGPLVTAPLDAAGAYRVEVRIAPRHHGPRLGTLGPAHAEREQVWIYGNPIYVR